VEVTENPTEGYYKLDFRENLHQLEAAERDMNVFKTLSKRPPAAPYPLQHFFWTTWNVAPLDSEQQNEPIFASASRSSTASLIAAQPLFVGKIALEWAYERCDADLQRLDAAAVEISDETEYGVLLGRFHIYGDAIR